MKQDKKNNKGEFQWEDEKRQVGNCGDILLQWKCTIFIAIRTMGEYKYDHGVEVYYKVLLNHRFFIKFLDI